MNETQREGKIIKVSGPLVVAEGLAGSKMYEMVRVGKMGLFGEIIEIRGGRFSIQVYDEPSGIGPGEPVVSTGAPLTVELGPGLITSIFDGVQRPLDKLRASFGDFVLRGAEVPPLDRKKKWRFVPRRKTGEKVIAGDIIGMVPESPIIEHRVMVPAGVEGVIVSISEKDATIEDTVAIKKTTGGEKVVTLQKSGP